MRETVAHRGLGFLANGAGVEKYNIGVVQVGRGFNAVLFQNGGYNFAVGKINLTTVVFNKEFATPRLGDKRFRGFGYSRIFHKYLFGAKVRIKSHMTNG